LRMSSYNRSKKLNVAEIYIRTFSDVVKEIDASKEFTITAFLDDEAKVLEKELS